MATNNSDFKIKKGLIVSEGITLGGHTFDDIDIGSEFVDTDDHIMSSGAIKEKIEDYGYIGGSIADNQVAVGSSTSDEIEGSAGYTATLGGSGSTNVLKFGHSDATTGYTRLRLNGTNAYLEFRDASDNQKGAIGFQSTQGLKFYAKAGGLGATEALRITPDDEWILNGTNTGTSGQVLTSGGSGAAVSWTTISSGDSNAGGVNGSAGSPTFSFTNDNDTGFYLDGTNTIGVSMGGSRKFRMYADTFRMDGTTNPQVIKCDNASVNLELRSGGGTYGKIHIGRENQDIEITPAGTGEVVLAGASKANKISVVAITTTTTLTDAQSGSYVYVTGSGAPTLPATAEIGQQYTIINNTGSNLTPGLGTSNSSIPSSHTAISDDAARTYVAVAANTWFFVG